MSQKEVTSEQLFACAQRVKKARSAMKEKTAEKTAELERLRLHLQASLTAYESFESSPASVAINEECRAAEAELCELTSQLKGW